MTHFEINKQNNKIDNLKLLDSDLIFRPPSILHKTGLLEKPMGINTLESHAPASYKKFFRLHRTAASL